MREGASDLGVPFRAFGEKRKHWPLSISLYTAASLAVSAVLLSFPAMFAEPQKSPPGEPPLRRPPHWSLGVRQKSTKAVVKRQSPTGQLNQVADTVESYDRFLGQEATD